MRIRPRCPAHTATTAHLAATYPFLAEGGLGGRGCYIGLDVYGSTFAIDPWLFMKQRFTTDLTMSLIGQKGRAKSSLAKCMCWRMLVFGVQSWICDPKGEWGPLCEAAGAVPIRLEPGGPVRLNPLDPRMVDPRYYHGDVRADQLHILTAILESALKRDLTPEEHTAVEFALGEAIRRGGGEPTLPLVVDALLSPSEDDAREVMTTAERLAAASRPAALTLRRLVSPTGALAGLFDGPSRGGVDLAAPIVSLDLSTLRDSPALGVLMTCAASWMQWAMLRKDGVRRLAVWDEAWEMMADLACVRWMRRALKYGRAYDVANLVIVHRASDFMAAGAGDSEQRRIAQGLIEDCETRILYWQRKEHLRAAADLLELSEADQRTVSGLPKGRGLWKVGGDHSFLVDHIVAPEEWSFVRTDDSDVEDDEDAA